MEEPSPHQRNTAPLLSKFELGEHGFTINQTFNWDAEAKRARSETSSMRAEIDSDWEPDLNSLPPIGIAPSDEESYQTDSFAASEFFSGSLSSIGKSQFLLGAGSWQVKAPVPPLMPWRLEVNLDDVQTAGGGQVLVAPVPTITLKNPVTTELKLIKSHIPTYVQPWRTRHDARSMDDASESQPTTLTFGSSDTESVILSEPPLRLEDYAGSAVCFATIPSCAMADLPEWPQHVMLDDLVKSSHYATLEIHESFEGLESLSSQDMPLKKAETINPRLLSPRPSSPRLNWNHGGNLLEEDISVSPPTNRNGGSEGMISDAVPPPPLRNDSKHTSLVAPPADPISRSNDLGPFFAQPRPCHPDEISQLDQECQLTSLDLPLNTQKRSEWTPRQFNQGVDMLLREEMEQRHENRHILDHLVHTQDNQMVIDERQSCLRRRSTATPGTIGPDCDGARDDESLCLEDDSSDTDSVWMSDYSSDGMLMLDENHPFLLAKPAVVRQGLLKFYAWRCQAAGKVSEARKADAQPFSSGERPKPEPNNKRHCDRDDEDPEEGNDGGGPPRKRLRASKQSRGRQVSLACPFAKKDPVRYRGCYAYILKRTNDVKQHLSRRHQLPLYCARCREPFNTEDQRDEHARTTICQAQDTPIYEGVTRAQKEQLGHRVSSRMTLADQWFTIFDILFPGYHPRPRSAFVSIELTVDLEGFQDLMIAEGPGIIAETIKSKGIQISASENEEHNKYTLLQAAIAEGLQFIAQRWTASYVADSAAIRANSLVDGSASSRSSHPGGSSQPSHASSDTLVENRRSVGILSPLQPLREETGEEAGEEHLNTDIGMDEVERAVLWLGDESSLPVDPTLSQLVVRAMPSRYPHDELAMGMGTDHGTNQTLYERPISDDEIFKEIDRHYPQDGAQNLEETDADI